MRFALMLLLLSRVVFSEDLSEYERYRLNAVRARTEAAKDPTVKDKDSAPVRAYRAEQVRRYNVHKSMLLQKLKDPKSRFLAPIFQQDLQDLESRNPQQVTFERKYNYTPATGLIGYPRNVRLIRTVDREHAIVNVEGVILLLSGFDTSRLNPAESVNTGPLLIGPRDPETRTLTASSVDLEELIGVQHEKF